MKKTKQDILRQSESSPFLLDTLIIVEQMLLELSFEQVLEDLKSSRDEHSMSDEEILCIVSLVDNKWFVSSPTPSELKEVVQKEDWTSVELTEDEYGSVIWLNSIQGLKVASTERIKR